MSGDVRHERADLAVIGAGPAGIAAAVAAAHHGMRVVVLDQGFAAGGQIWRHAPGTDPAAEARPWIERLHRSGAALRFNASVVDIGRVDDGFVLRAEQGSAALRVEAARIVIATGARELVLPFPGWTMPNVIGVGAAQALLKMGTPLRGKRVVVAGSGPLMLPVAASLARAGARIALVAEQAVAADVARFAASLWSRPSLLLRAARYRSAFATARYATGTWVTSAEGDVSVRRVTVTDGRASTTLDCDVLCVGHGLVPATELARVAGCAVRDGAVVVDARQETSVADVYCAGEPTGIGGAELSLVEGTIAGLCAAGRDADAARLHAERASRRSYAGRMAHAFAPRAELRDACTASTIVCRCEDVPLGAIDRGWSARQAKLYTRAGMGPCQGRVCGAALAFHFGWEADTVRPPIEPVLLSTLLADAEPGAASHTGSD